MKGKCKWQIERTYIGWWGKERQQQMCRKHMQDLSGPTCTNCPDYEPAMSTDDGHTPHNPGGSEGQEQESKEA